MKLSFNCRAGGVFALALCLISVGCARRQAMYLQPKYTPQGQSDFFEDGQQSRPLVEGTIPRGADDDHLNKALVNGVPATHFPFPVTRQVMERGQNRYNIFCAPCHSQTGDGLGMIVQRGFLQPVSLHEPRLKSAAPFHFFNVITHGIGMMSGYSAQVPPADRWAIIAYIRALQKSQDGRLSDVPGEKRAELEVPQ